MYGDSDGSDENPYVYIVETNAFPNSVVEVATAVPAFIGYTGRADNNGKSLKRTPWPISSIAEYENYFGGAPSPTFHVTEITPQTPPAARAPVKEFGSEGRRRDSFPVQAMSNMQAFVNYSPYVTAQRQRLNSTFGEAAQQDGARLQGKEAAVSSAQFQAGGRARNNTGLPGQLKSGIESLSGIAMDDVNVHYNSSQPAQLNALAYAQGTDIYLGPGQERHLPHEACMWCSKRRTRPGHGPDAESRTCQRRYWP